MINLQIKTLKCLKIFLVKNMSDLKSAFQPFDVDKMDIKLLWELDSKGPTLFLTTWQGHMLYSVFESRLKKGFGTAGLNPSWIVSLQISLNYFEELSIRLEIALDNFKFFEFEFSFF